LEVVLEKKLGGRSRNRAKLTAKQNGRVFLTNQVVSSRQSESRRRQKNHPLIGDYDVQAARPSLASSGAGTRGIVLLLFDCGKRPEQSQGTMIRLIPSSFKVVLATVGGKMG
jgi:hypothetical protein